MAESIFKEGDTVYLNSGGPAMTVVSTGTVQTNVIYWNIANNRFEEYTFSTNNLYKSF